MRRKTRNAKTRVSTLTRMLVPGHAGKPEIAGTRYLDDSALAKVKRATSAAVIKPAI